jgi:tRNA threonylcarbamoyladenosine biosynthesis protein TsaE
MKALGARLIEACSSGGIITLSGDLGTGKTTLVRGALESQGVTSGVRSPTYTLIENYPLSPLAIAHFDLYRLADAEELEYLGFRDYLNKDTLCLIEWPERAGEMLAQAGLQLHLAYREQCREVTATATDDWGREITTRLKLNVK